MEFNVAQVHEALAAAMPDRECVVFRDRRLTWAEFRDRTRRFANLLAASELGATRKYRAGLAGHESHQDHLAIYCHNGNEYLEAMVGAFKARVAPLNVNYRYVAEELRHILSDSGARAIVFHSRFAPTLAEVLPHLPRLTLLLQVEDDSGIGLLPRARWYEDALAASPTGLPVCSTDWSPDDLYILYTGGTTGLPKGVLWRQHDIFMSALGGRPQGGGDPHESIDSVVRAASAGGMRALPAAPLMHGASQWVALLTMHTGGTVVIQDVVDRYDPASVLATCEREQVNLVLIVGDALGRPLLDHLEDSPHDLSTLFAVVSGGAALSEGLKQRFLAAIPHAVVVDGLGSSEGGSQAQHITAKGSTVATGTFGLQAPGTCVVDSEKRRLLDPGDAVGEIGWLAKRGDVPLGYLGDAAKTSATFPVIDGVRYSIPGDRARWSGDGSLGLLGRDSVTINSGGEKIFAEEVEAALLRHPDVYDVVVTGRPSATWGQEVVAVVQLRDGIVPDAATTDALTADAAHHVARFKLPKDYLFVPTVQRSPAGKADYRWAKAQVVHESADQRDH